MKPIAVIGAHGQLGTDLTAALAPGVIPLGHADLDLTDRDGLTRTLQALQPDGLINCAAYNLVDRAEDEPEAAFAVNAFGVRNLAQWCAAHNVPLMHISTDYVFGMNQAATTPLTEEAAPGPVSVYGASKLAGEHFVRMTCAKSWIVRTCGLYGRQGARGKGNFVETMLRLASERPELRIVHDQRCTPTSTTDLAPLLAALVRTQAYGVFHATNSGDCSWFEFAREIFRCAGLSPRVTPVTAAEYGAKARRPDYSVLNNDKVASMTGIRLRPWQEALRDYLAGR